MWYDNRHRRQKEPTTHVQWWDDHTRFRLSPHIDGLENLYAGMGYIAVHDGRLIVPELSIRVNEDLKYCPYIMDIPDFYGVYLVPRWHTYLKIYVPYTTDGDEDCLVKVPCVSKVGGHMIRAFQHREVPVVQVYGGDHVFIPLEFFVSDVIFSDGVSTIFTKRLIVPTPERLKTVVQALGGCVCDKMIKRYADFLKTF